LVRTRVEEVSTVGRNTQGVRLIRTIEGEHVVGLQRIDEIEELEIELIEGEESGLIEAVVDENIDDGTDNTPDDDTQDNEDE
ncbi:MAG: DNA gyrase subunit A, partial [Bermanella sp.]